MTEPGGFDLHPEAAQDIIEIWEHIAAESPVAAGRVRGEILQAIGGLVVTTRCLSASVCRSSEERLYCRAISRMPASENRAM